MKLEKPSLDKPELKESTPVPLYGDQKIDQAKGKCAPRSFAAGWELTARGV